VTPPAPIAERSAGSLGVHWFPLMGRSELSELLKERGVAGDEAVLSGESRIEARVRDALVCLRAYEMGRHGRARPIAMLCRPQDLYLFAPETSEACQAVLAEEPTDAFDAFALCWEAVVAGYQDESEAAVEAAEEVAERVLVGPRRGLSHRTYRVRRRAFALRRALQRAQAVFAVVEAELPPAWGDEARLRLAELAARVRRAHGDVESVRESLGEAVEAYTSVQSNDMTHVMQVLTIISLLFLPSTLVASIYGMNFRIPEYGWPNGYAWALGLMAALTGLVLFWAARRNWLR